MTPAQINRFKLHHVVVADCTYKTNRYGLPLLRILGVSGNNETFQIAACLVHGESEGDFRFHLGALREVMTENGVNVRLFVVDRCQAFMNAIENVFEANPIPQVSDLSRNESGTNALGAIGDLPLAHEQRCASKG